SLALCRCDSLYRIQPDFLPPIHSWLSRHAAPLSQLSSRISGSQRTLNGGSFYPGARLSPPHVLPHLVHALRQGCRSQSLAGHGSRMENGFATAYGKLSRYARGRLGALRFPESPGSWLGCRSAIGPRSRRRLTLVCPPQSAGARKPEGKAAPLRVPHKDFVDAGLHPG